MRIREAEGGPGGPAAGEGKKNTFDQELMSRRAAHKLLVWCTVYIILYIASFPGSPLAHARGGAWERHVARFPFQIRECN